jgi:CelD/BcsL family acetyltransferase involved in cellulose biosynthesis
MQFTRHLQFSEIPADEWNQLAGNGISNTPFARHEYLGHWWSTLGGGEWPNAELVLVSASEAGELIGIAPLFVANHDQRPAILQVGSIEISDYLDLIVQAKNLDPFLKGLIDFLEEDSSTHGLPLDWYNIPDSSPIIPALEAEARARDWRFELDVFRPTPRIRLEGDFESFLASLEKKQRHEIRRKLRRADEATAPAEMHLVQSPSDLEGGIQVFLDLMANDPRKAEFLRPEMRDHMRNLIRLAYQQGYLWLAFLNIGDAQAAACLNFDYDGKLWGYNSGVNAEFADISPGWVLLARQIEWALKNGRREFDFMRGDEDYKYRFGGKNSYVMRVQAGAA